MRCCVGTRDRTEMLEAKSQSIIYRESNEISINNNYLRILFNNLNKLYLNFQLLNIISQFLINKKLDIINKKANEKKRHISKEIETMKKMFEI